MGGASRLWTGQNLTLLWDGLKCENIRQLFDIETAGPGAAVQAPMINNPAYKGKWYAPKKLATWIGRIECENSVPKNG